MMIVTRISDGTLPVGGAQYASHFIGLIQPNEQHKVKALNPGERTTVTMNPLPDRQGYQVEVYRCPGR